MEEYTNSKEMKLMVRFDTVLVRNNRMRAIDYVRETGNLLLQPYSPDTMGYIIEGKDKKKYWFPESCLETVFISVDSDQGKAAVKADIEKQIDELLSVKDTQNDTKENTKEGVSAGDDPVSDTRP